MIASNLSRGKKPDDEWNPQKRVQITSVFLSFERKLAQIMLIEDPTDKVQNRSAEEHAKTDYLSMVFVPIVSDPNTDEDYVIFNFTISQISTEIINLEKIILKPIMILNFPN